MIQSLSLGVQKSMELKMNESPPSGGHFLLSSFIFYSVEFFLLLHLALLWYKIIYLVVQHYRTR